MTVKLGVVMDAIQSISYKKDSTFALLLEAQSRHFELYYFEQKDLFLRDGIPYGNAKILKVFRDADTWFSFQAEKKIPLSELQIILMRKDPPFNEQYIYTTYLLEYAERLGVFVMNRPQALRDINEKIAIMEFPEYISQTLVTRSMKELQNFWKEQKDIVCKPLHAMGGFSVFRLQENEVNANVIFQKLTENETTEIMAQRFIPEIIKGDKRILMIDGEPFPHVLARIPQGEDWRGNLAAGAKGTVQMLSNRDQAICALVGPFLKKHGLYFVGLDVIGDYLTEINVTSPTGIRELESALQVNISGLLFDKVEKYLKK